VHWARRDVLEVHPRSEQRRPLTGVFATRTPDPPNPLGLHCVTVRRVAKNRLRIGLIEAIDTPAEDFSPPCIAASFPKAPNKQTFLVHKDFLWEKTASPSLSL